MLKFNLQGRKRTSVLLPFHFCFAALALTACGSGDKITVKDMNVGTSTVNSRIYANLEATVLMGNLRFPNLELPVTNPQNSQTIGHLRLQALSDGSSRVTVGVDFEQALRLDASLGRTLPNGREIPNSLGANNATLIGIRSLEQSRIYVGGDLNRDLFVGIAVAIPAFDNTMNQVPIPLNIFYQYGFSPSISGVAGLFTGPVAGQNGVAIFGKRSAPAATESKRILASEANAVNSLGRIAGPSDDNEIQKLDRITLFRLDRLFKKNATLRVK